MVVESGGELIRNFCIISHVDHGKTTLSDHLISMGGLLPHQLAGKLRALDYENIEQARGITIKPSVATFYLSINGRKVLVNLIDTPGHVDFSWKTNYAMAMADNCIIIVDAVEGVMAQTKSVVLEAISNGHRLILFINKIDRLIHELTMTQSEIRGRIERIVGEIHYLCMRDDNKNNIPSFARGTVIIGSALDGWGIDIESTNNGISLSTIQDWYSSSEMNIEDEAKLTYLFKRVFLDKFVDPSTAKGFKNSKFNISSQGTSLLVGQNLLLGRGKKVTHMARIIQGEVIVGQEIVSNLLDRKFVVERIAQLRGKKRKEVDMASEGEIIAVEFSEGTEPGDILTGEKDTEIVLPIIKSKPVVQISVEPQELGDIESLRNYLELFELLNPGIYFDESEDTGEFLLSGMGTLQLEILVEQIEEMGIKLWVSDPEEIHTVQPIKEFHYSLAGYDFSIDHADFNNTHDCKLQRKSDNLKFYSNLNKEVIEGVYYSFLENIRTKFPQKMKLASTFVEISCSEEGFNTFEDGIILGNKMMRIAGNQGVFQVHAPYYIIELNSPQKYTGELVNNIQQQGGKIISIKTEDEAKIRAEIGIIQANKLADVLRRASDGYIYWNFVKTVYKIK